MSETSVMNAMDDALPSIGYLNVHGICRRTYGKGTKAHTDNPHFPTHNVNWGYPTQECLIERRKKAMAVEPENPAWVRNAHSSTRGIMTLTWRRSVVIVY